MYQKGYQYRYICYYIIIITIKLKITYYQKLQFHWMEM
jgi:hypothetical protein